MNFEECVAIVIQSEGDYVYDERDPGGETKYGISKRAYPQLEIRSLTKEDAALLYKRDYWDMVQGDRLPDYMRLLVFDCAVNQGVARACLYMQRSVGVPADGVIGPMTLEALFKEEPSVFIKSFAEMRHAQYMKSSGWQYYGGGWSKRLLDVVILTFAYLVMYA